MELHDFFLHLFLYYLLCTECSCPTKMHVGKTPMWWMILWDGGFEEVIRSQKWSSHEWDQCPYKRDLKGLPCTSWYVRAQQEDGRLWARQRASANSRPACALIWNCPASKLVRNKFPLFLSPPVYYGSPNRLRHFQSQDFSNTILCP